MLDPLNLETRGRSGSHNFRALAGALDFDVIVIDSRLCGVVVAAEDNGVQVNGHYVSGELTAEEFSYTDLDYRDDDLQRTFEHDKNAYPQAKH